VPHTIVAPVEIPKGGAEGVIACLGGDAAGWSLFCWEGKIRYHYNYFNIARYDLMSEKPLSPGKHVVRVEFAPESLKPGCPANVKLLVDDVQVAAGRVERQVPMRCGTETMDIGMDCVSPVCHDYEEKGLFPFTGTIESVTFTFPNVPQPTGMDRLKMATQMD